MSTTKDEMDGGDEVIGDDERAPLADEEKVPLSTDGSREDMVAAPGGGGGGGDSEQDSQSDTVVVKKTAIATTTGSQDDGCCARCCRCLANVPYGSLVCWVLLAAMVSTCAGSLMVALMRTRDLMGNENILPFSDALCLGVLFGMVFIATVLLVVASVSSPPTSMTVFDSSAKNMCARVLNLIMVYLLVLLVLVWTVICVVLAIPVALIVLLHMLYTADPSGCIDLYNYALTSEKDERCGDDLKYFYNQIFKKDDIMICYSISLIAAVLVVVSLVLFTVCTTSNYIHVRESRRSDYSAYKNEVLSSKNSTVDTRM